MFPLRIAALAGALWLALAAPALAHGLEGGGGFDWTFTPWITVPLSLSAISYAFGGFRLARRSRAARSGRNALLFWSGWLCLAAATVSPLHAAGERSFALHMIEHEVLMLAAAPLLVLSHPWGVMLWSLPKPARRAVGMVTSGPLRTAVVGLARPTPATVVQLVALWLWHVPALFDAALGSAGWHVAQHLTFLVTALLFWRAMLRPEPASLLLRAGCLFVTSVVAGALGALMAFSASPWYARYASLGLAPFGLTPSEDQQLAGLLMWIPGGLVHVGAALALLGRSLSKDAIRQR